MHNAGQTCYKNTLLVIQLCTITFSYYGAPLGLYMYDGNARVEESLHL